MSNIIKTSVRGNAIEWIAMFRDKAGNPTQPTAVDLYVKHGDVREDIAMQRQSDGSYFATFETAGVPAGTLYWSIRTSRPSVAADDQIELSANPANPDPA